MYMKTQEEFLEMLRSDEPVLAPSDCLCPYGLGYRPTVHEAKRYIWIALNFEGSWEKRNPMPETWYYRKKQPGYNQALTAFKEWVQTDAYGEWFDKHYNIGQ